MLLLFSGCLHDPPLSSGRYTPDVPPGTGALYRMTYNPGADLSPTWLPDGKGFLYTIERLDRHDHDRCLALLPPAGGTIERQICNRAVAADDSVDAFWSGAEAPDGRLAYVRSSASLAVGWPVAPASQGLVLATLAAPTDAQLLQRIPYQGPSGRSHDLVTQVQWLNDSTLVYLASHVDYAAPCDGCPLDTLASGLEIVRFDLGPSPVLSMLPGTDQASSVAVVHPDTVYFTINGDSRVFRLALESDSLAVVHDFGLQGIARDVQVVGSRLVTIVGGAVSFTTDPPLGPTQRDGGGYLMLVDLSTGTERTITADSTWRHPALAPDGGRLVAELVTGRTTDLWFVAVP